MNINDRINAFVKLGQTLKGLDKSEFDAMVKKANHENGWFTEESILMAFRGLSVLLEEKSLKAWATSYSLEPAISKIVGIAMAGNIPLVGFHDFLCVLISGHNLRYKPSSKDSVMLDFVQQKLIDIEARFRDRIHISDYLKGVDAIIATGSDNTSRYFEFYFRNIPHIIRKNRVSCAVIQGDEPENEIVSLGEDIFSYYGLGCRNVSSLFVPREMEITSILDRLNSFERVMLNHKYANNYTYQRSLAMLNQEPHLDNGFLLIKENSSLVSPVAVLHYLYYDDLHGLKQSISSQKDKIQVIVSAQGWFEGSVPFGIAQLPQVIDYADNVDTMRFLGSLSA